MQQIIQYLLCITLLLNLLHYCTSNDTISQNQAFKDGDTLMSTGGTFAFGFFSPGNSKNRYLGIWYNRVSEQTVVWVANRNSPIINGTTGILSLETHGNLVLRDQIKNALIWSTNVSGDSKTANSSFVQLLETGNLVLFKDLGIISWQSFDYPTDTHLPHMKLGVNRASGLPWSLTSWKSRDDPGTGDFQFRMVLNGSPQFFLFKNSEKLWRSGPWNGVHLSGVPDMTSKFIFSINYVEDEDEVSLSYMIHNPNIFSRLALNESGTLERLTWQETQHSWNKFWAAPKEQCDYNSHCGQFSNCDPYKYGEFECECLPGYEPESKSEWYLRDSVNGCIRKPGKPTCGNGSSDDPGGFVKLASVKIPDTVNAVLNRVSGLKECADSCLKNCSCTAYSSANVSNGGSGCISWYGQLLDMRQFSNQGQDVYIRVTSSELAQYLKNLKGGKRSKKWIIILVASISGFLVLAFAVFVVLKWRKGKGKRTKNIDSLLSFNLHSPASASSYGGTSSRNKEIDDSSRDVSMFDLKTLVSATDCFALSNLLGQGGFGSVYKGRLHDGREIAIKRLSKSSGQGTEEFKNEVTLIARLQHRNLVRLLGCCVQQEEKMLVYEYLPNKGLDYFIFDDERRASLDWRKRFEIILGIARGIVYLHRDSRLKIIHRDLKASNVLLDANMDPKISDFGMARIFGADQMEEQTLRVVGTYGYMSPEYAMLGLFSEKSDVFSYGVLLLEIISGKKNNSYFSENSVNLIGYVWELWKEGHMALEMVDEAIQGESYNQYEVARCIRIGLLCVQEQAMDRPTMSEVLSMLCNETSVPSTSPKEPAYVVKKGKNDGHNYNLPYSSSASIGTSVDSATITVLQAR